MDTFWWVAAVVLMLVGLAGTVLPIVPGSTIILVAAIGHRLLVGAEKGIGWWGIAGLLALTLVSYAVDLAAGYVGAKYFGATRWGVIGAMIGVIVGIVTGFVTLLVAPIIGAIVGELIGGKQMREAGKAGWGTLLGNLVGMVAKLAIGVAMICWWLMAVPWPTDALRRPFTGVDSARWQMIAGEPRGSLEESPNTTRQHAT